MMFLGRKNLGLMCLTAMVLFATGLAMTASAGPSEAREAKRSMTGVWVSNPPASWVVRYEGGTLAGSTLMRWELEEDENGLISGFNIWHSPLLEVGVPQVGAYCMVGARNEFIEKNPIATKRALRAILKAADICSQDPELAARFLVEKGYEPRYDVALEVLKSLSYDRWRTDNPTDTIRFHCLRLRDAGMIKSTPQQIIERGSNFTFLNELKRELKA